MMKIKQRPLKANVGFFFFLEGKIKWNCFYQEKGKKRKHKLEF